MAPSLALMQLLFHLSLSVFLKSNLDPDESDFAYSSECPHLSLISFSRSSRPAVIDLVSLILCFLLIRRITERVPTRLLAVRVALRPFLFPRSDLLAGFSFFPSNGSKVSPEQRGTFATSLVTPAYYVGQVIRMKSIAGLPLYQQKL